MLAFDRDPLFSRLKNPLLRVETKREHGRERWWIWKERDFFWFWIEDSPDFFGLFCEDQYHRIQSRAGGWFERAHATDDERELRAIFKTQINHGEWVRAISLLDPRPGKNAVWRILWRGRLHFLLQHTKTNRAVRFHPETNWDVKSPHWREMKRHSEGADFFAARFEPLLLQRRGRLASALEWLELPLAEQENPILFLKGEAQDFQSVLRAALIMCYSWPDDVKRRFSLRFHHRYRTPIYGLMTIRISSQSSGHYQFLREPQDPRLQRIAAMFGPSLAPSFALHSIAPSPFSLSTRDNEPRLFIEAQGPLSYHELLEARLTVRDWLNQNAPELLPDLS